MSTVRCLWEARALLGEGPAWIEARQRLYFVDIKAPAVHALDLADGTRHSWPMPAEIGWLIPHPDGGCFVAGLCDGFALLWLEPEVRIEYLARPHADRPELRLNDAKLDRWGHIWAGSMNDPDPSRPDGRLYRLDPDGQWMVADDGYHVCNGPTFSPDGRTLYHNDSWLGRVYAYDLDPSGTLGNRRLWRQFGEGEGLPDGMTTDRDGCLWIAQWGAGRVGRFSPAGELLRSIELPASQITSCVLDADEKRLFVTSARKWLSDAQLAAEPLAGAVFEVTL
ncbi:SMP-30/gluconolactonase/LRE family protein [Chitinimonas koreensis]|uniref:SMP-30/gluconolactonase/LRE family protein n=1 Tax=Chitinimonas koreensis TaxID=356302 RepID=UPI00068458EB|nr:SMP-30/gluconolactonase/LRE family protein [Chitinimonas koreensis]